MCLRQFASPLHRPNGVARPERGCLARRWLACLSNAMPLRRDVEVEFWWRRKCRARSSRYSTIVSVHSRTPLHHAQPVGVRHGSTFRLPCELVARGPHSHPRTLLALHQLLAGTLPVTNQQPDPRSLAPVQRDVTPARRRQFWGQSVWSLTERFEQLRY